MRKLSSLLTSFVLSFAAVSTIGCASTDGDDEYSTTEDEASTAGKFSFWAASDGQWHFNVKSGNGRILLTSEAYTARTGAINGALSVLENGVDPLQYELVEATHGYVVHLVAANHQTISFSEVYATKSSANRAITSCVRAITSYLDKREAASTGARVDVLQGESGKFRFNVYARNGQIVLSSESYTTEAAAFNGAFAVQAEGQNAASYNVLTSANGSYYFTLSALNGQVIGVSQQYATKAAANSAISSLKSLLGTLTVL
ncbi:MAG: DUF1508 domain-containing protein [Kofleriaceae bacterium]